MFDICGFQMIHSIQFFVSLILNKLGAIRFAIRVISIQIQRWLFYILHFLFRHLPCFCHKYILQVLYIKNLLLESLIYHSSWKTESVLSNKNRNPLSVSMPLYMLRSLKQQRCPPFYKCPFNRSPPLLYF